MADLMKKQPSVGDGMFKLFRLMLWKRLLLLINVWLEGRLCLIGLDGGDRLRLQELMMKFNRFGWQWRKRRHIVAGRLGAKLVLNSLEHSGTLSLAGRSGRKTPWFGGRGHHLRGCRAWFGRSRRMTENTERSGRRHG